MVPFTMANFLRLLNEHVVAFLHISFQCPLSRMDVDQLYRDIRSLVISRCQYFVRRTNCEESGVPGRHIRQVQDNYVDSLIDKCDRIRMEILMESSCPAAVKDIKRLSLWAKT
jgi:hypothetical protein